MIIYIFLYKIKYKNLIKKVDIVHFFGTIVIGEGKMGRPKKENIVKTEEEIKRDERLKELEKEVIRQIVVARKSQHLSQRVVGERAGIIRETVAKIENNLNSPQINTLIRLLEPIGYTLGVVPLEQKEEAEETAVVNN